MGRGLHLWPRPGCASNGEQQACCDAQFAHGELSTRTLADRAFRRVKSTPSKGKDRDRMGEAKRRRQQAAERTETVIELDEQTNEERRVETIVRDGGSVATFLKKGLNGVPCNGCRMCCYHPRIEVEPQDDVRHLVSNCVSLR